MCLEQALWANAIQICLAVKTLNECTCWGASIFSHLNVDPSVYLNETTLLFHLHFGIAFYDISSIYYSGARTECVRPSRASNTRFNTKLYMRSLIFQLWIKVRQSSV